jgi:ABC-type lipoprotein export system ATPase subunit
MGDLLVLRNVSKSYRRGERRHRVLTDVSLEVGVGEIVAAVGSRDEGKTTLLKIAAGMERPDAGAVQLGDLDLTTCSDERHARLLGDAIAWTHRGGTGLRLEVLDYVGLPLAMGRGHGRREAQELAAAALERVGAADCARQRWVDLSNWQRVLVGLARGIVGGPRLLVVDDVIDGLGMRRTQEAGVLLRALADELGCGVLMSATDLEATLAADRVWSFGRGHLTLLSDQAGARAEIIKFPEGARQSRSARGAHS